MFDPSEHLLNIGTDKKPRMYFREQNTVSCGYESSIQTPK